MKKHIPVLLSEVIESLDIKPDGFYIDGTFGRGGHSRAILEKLSANGKLLVVDKDLVAIKEANSLTKTDNRVLVKHGSFSQLFDFCEELDVVGKVNGILVDLGVSSPQLDEAERGFSFNKEGPLDMRMDTSSGVSAADWLNQASFEDIRHVLRVYGEEKLASKIAKTIVAKRDEKPITQTLELAKLISDIYPKKEQKKHPATRSFQAIRIFINNELEDLELFLQGVVKVLAPKGRMSVISFHSLEDRIVKRFIQDNIKGETLPKHLPIKDDMLKKAKFRKIGKFSSPSESEVSENVRARSAKLRVMEKI